MSDDTPRYRMVNGELVELTQDEIDELLREWGQQPPASLGTDPQEAHPQPRTEEHHHERGRSKRR